MATKRSGRQTDSPTEEDSLARLLDAERTLDELLSSRQREADDIVAKAESEAQRRHEELAAVLERETSALEKSVEDDRNRRIDELRSSSAKRLQHWNDSNEEAIDSLANSVVSWVIRGTGDGTGTGES